MSVWQLALHQCVAALLACERVMSCEFRVAHLHKIPACVRVCGFPSHSHTRQNTPPDNPNVSPTHCECVDSEFVAALLARVSEQNACSQLALHKGVATQARNSH